MNGANINTIYAPLASPTFTGTAAAPTINATTALQVNGANINTLYAPLASPSFTGTPTIGANAIATRPWVIGRVNAGASSLTFQNGLQTATATRNAGAGDYTITWPNTGLGTSYVQLTCAAPKNAPRHVNYINLTATGCNVYITDTTGASVDSDFNIRVDVFS